MKRRFEVNINLDNAAFADGARESELARILRDLAGFIENDYQLDDDIGVPWMLFDINGNTVGSAIVRLRKSKA